MNRILLIILIFCFSFTAYTQTTPETVITKTKKITNVLNNFSVIATAGSGNYHDQFSQLGRVSLGEIGLQYKLTPNFSFGISTMGSVLCNESFYDAEGNLVLDDDMDDDDIDDMDDPNDPDDLEEDDDAEDDSDCEDEFGSNVVGNMTYKISEKLPLFIRANGGYSFNSNSLVYSFSVGYHQKLVAGLGLLVGVRYSDLIKLNSTRDYAGHTGGIKGELGLSWNF